MPTRHSKLAAMAFEIQLAMEKWTKDFQSYVDKAVKTLHDQLQERVQLVEVQEKALIVREKVLEERERKIEFLEKQITWHEADTSSPVRSCMTPASIHTPTHATTPTPRSTSTSTVYPQERASMVYLSEGPLSQNHHQGGKFSARKAHTENEPSLTPSLSKTQMNGDQGAGQPLPRNCLMPGSASRIRDMFEQKALSARQQHTSSLSSSRGKQFQRPSSSTTDRLSASNSSNGSIRRSLADLIKVDEETEA